MNELEEDQAIALLNRLLEENRYRSKELEIEKLKSEEEEKQLKKENEANKKEAKKSKGEREALLFDTLSELKANPTHHGELSFTGNNCWRVLRNRKELLGALFLEEEKERKDVWEGLFEKLAVVGEILYRVPPFLAVPLKREEIEIIEGNEQEQEGKDQEEEQQEEEENQLQEEEVQEEELQEEGYQSEEEDDTDISELDAAILAIEELHDYYLAHFEKDPIPKQHFLVSHATSFLLRNLSLGMFAEQGVESVHSTFNTCWRRYRNSPQKAELAIANFNSHFESRDRHRRRGRKRKQPEFEYRVLKKLKPS